MQEPSRRSFLGGMGVVAGSGLTSTLGAAEASLLPSKPGAGPDDAILDVLVLGAGYSGLAAATLLRSRGRTVAVLEARDRVGGRAVDRLIGPGRRVELGGQFVVPAQKRVLELAHEMGLEAYASWDEGDWFLGALGRFARYRSSPLQCLVDSLGQPAAVRSEIEAALQALEDLYSSVPASMP
jgi:monoamine oxidase